MKIKYLLMFLLCFQFNAHAQQDSEEELGFESTYPIVEGTEVWDVKIDSLELSPHFLVSKMVVSEDNKQVYMNFMTVKDYQAKEQGKITGVWLEFYNEENSLLGVIDQ